MASLEQQVKEARWTIQQNSGGKCKVKRGVTVRSAWRMEQDLIVLWGFYRG